MSDLKALTPGTWTVDASHSNIGFTARHLMVAKVRGKFTDFTGAIEVASDPLLSTVNATVEAKSIDTGDEGRDTHLRSADFFDVDNNKQWTLVSTGIKAAGSNYVLSTNLTIKGVTKPVDFALEFEGVVQDPWGNTKAGFTAEAEINRKDWGLEWNVALETGGVLVGEKVKIVLEIEALKS
ncbi:MAG: YceI family protein [Actinomycetia bacterium]|nr:YceI family protein [Actinomycetes bacterium]